MRLPLILWSWLQNQRNRLFWAGTVAISASGVFPWGKVTLCLVGLICLGLFLASFLKPKV